MTILRPVYFSCIGIAYRDRRHKLYSIVPSNLAQLDSGVCAPTIDDATGYPAYAKSQVAASIVCDC
jgi:hypothetical protein